MQRKTFSRGHRKTMDGFSMAPVQRSRIEKSWRPVGNGPFCSSSQKNYFPPCSLRENDDSSSKELYCLCKLAAINTQASKKTVLSLLVGWPQCKGSYGFELLNVKMRESFLCPTRFQIGPMAVKGILCTSAWLPPKMRQDASVLQSVINKGRTRKAQKVRYRTYTSPVEA